MTVNENLYFRAYTNEKSIPLKHNTTTSHKFTFYPSVAWIFLACLEVMAFIFCLLTLYMVVGTVEFFFRIEFYRI